jgi:hypothetical protein
LSSSSFADSIPKEYHGEWCVLSGKPYFSPKVEIEEVRRFDKSMVSCGKDSDGWIKIGANRYDGHEQWCKPTKIKVDEIRAHIITFKCRYEGDETETITCRFVTTTGTKGRGKRLYIDEVK